MVDEGAADALPACLLGDYEPAQVAGRRVCADEQATEQIGLVTGDCDERGGLPDMLSDGCAEAWVIDQRTKPVLDLSGQLDEAGHVLVAASLTIIPKVLQRPGDHAGHRQI